MRKLVAADRLLTAPATIADHVRVARWRWKDDGVLPNQQGIGTALHQQPHQELCRNPKQTLLASTNVRNGFTYLD